MATDLDVVLVEVYFGLAEHGTPGPFNGSVELHSVFHIGVICVGVRYLAWYSCEGFQIRSELLGG